MKNLYIKQKQKDKNKLYTRFSKYCLNHSKDLQELIYPFINKIEINFNFDNKYYDILDKEQRSFYGDCVDSLLSGGSYKKVNCYRYYFHQSMITPDDNLKQHIEDTIKEVQHYLNVYNYTYPRWKTIYYPDGKYRTHLDLIVGNMWNQEEVFDITINEDNKMMLSKMVELLALTKFTFGYLNVLNLYNGQWYSLRVKNLPDNIIHQCSNLFADFVKVRIKEEEENVDGK